MNALTPDPSWTDPLSPRRKDARQRAIVDAVSRHGFASIEDLAGRLAVTAQTIRRDIADLEADGLIRRYHGGAGLPDAVDPAYYRRRKVENVEAKRRIGAAIAALVPDGASLFLDAGTTAEAIAAALGARRGLTVATYNLRVANVLAESGDARIAVPGGIVRNADGSVFGEGAAAFLRQFRYDLAVVCASGVDDEGMILDDDYNEVELVRAAIGGAGRVVLAADASKFRQRGVVCLGPIAAVGLLVTDAAPTGRLAAAIAAAGVEVAIA